MIQEMLLIIGLTLLPAFELRASIPYGIFFTDLHWTFVFVLAVLVNTLLGPLIYFLVDKVVHLFFFMKWFEKLYNKILKRSQKKIEKHVDKWGELGLALFIGIPLPGSGSYTGAIGAYVLGLSFKKFIIANLIGVLLAASVVTLICLLGGNGWELFVKSV